MPARPGRVAAIDCGTNSIRLLIADHGDGRLTDVVRELRVVRLGQGVDRTGRFAPEALARTAAALREYATLITEHRAGSVRMVATSAARDVTNRDEFESLVVAELGIAPDVITGEQEAQLSFDGAVRSLAGITGPLLVADIGGGSTELVRGGDGPLQAHSMDVGCVRLTERHLHDDPPTPAQVAAVEAEVRGALARVTVPLTGAATFVGVAGTVTTLAALALDLPGYDAQAIHGSSMSREQVAALTARLLTMPRAERAALPVMHPGRVDVICAGALILRTLMAQIEATAVRVSEHDILDGVALQLAEG